MRNVPIIIPLTLVAQAHVQELLAKRTADVQDSMDKLVNGVANALFHRTFQVGPLHHTDLDDTTLGKYTPTPQARKIFRPINLYACAENDKVKMPTECYLSEYGTVYDHVGMLQDKMRMNAYHDAIKKNSEIHFKDKVVLDVGTGTGILAIWAAQAGAKKVYAVEGSSVYVATKEMVAAHDFTDVIEVLHGCLEDVELPEKVDVIVSEWMGFLLFRESMFQSVLVARDRWLKPDGVMYPSRARLWMAPLGNRDFRDRRQKETDVAMTSWAKLTADLATKYEIDLSALKSRYLDEHFQYNFRQAWLGYIKAEELRGEAQMLLDINMHTVKPEDLFGPPHALTLKQVSAPPNKTSPEPVYGLCGWFDVVFGGNDKLPAQKEFRLDTSPKEKPTHWAQTVLSLEPPLISPEVHIRFSQSVKRHHDLNVTLQYDQTTASYGITNSIPWGTSSWAADAHDVK